MRKKLSTSIPQYHICYPIPLINSDGQAYPSAARACQAYGRSRSNSADLIGQIIRNGSHPRWGVRWFVDFANVHHLALREMCARYDVDPESLHKYEPLLQ